MDEIWQEGKTRPQLENHIVDMANNVPVSDPKTGNFDWLYSQQLTEFIDAWYALAKYYEISSDTVVSVEAISEYVSYTRLFRRLMSDDTLDEKHRQRAEEQLTDLDSHMDEIIKEAVSNLNV